MARFSDLPQELRDIIWQFAVRPEGPAAHYLSIRHWHEDDHLVEPHHDHEWSIGNSFEPESESFGSISETSDTIQFSAPGFGRDGSSSLVLGNYSAYMEDSALWTTCWDSRHHMIQRYRPRKTNRRTSRKRRLRHWSPEDVTVTAPLQRDNGERQHLTVQPMKDLIILQTLPGSHSSLDRSIDDEILPEIDEWWDRLRYCNMYVWLGWPHGTCCHPENIAFQFDPKWMEQKEKAVRRFNQALYMHISTLWFVDDRLQLKPEGERLERTFESKVFNAMGRRFVEVDYRDVVVSESCEWEYQVFDFVNRLEDMRHTSMSMDRSLWFNTGWEPSGCEFKVLACELL